MGSGIKAVVAALAATASVAANAIASEWTVVDLTPGSMGIANAISRNGNVTGCRVSATGQTQAFIYDGQTRDLAAPAGSTSCGLAVNNAGVVAGRIDGEITIWTGGQPQRLGVQGTVTGIAENGTIVGSITDGPLASGAPTRAFMWSNGVFTDFGLPGSAIDINASGQVAIVSNGRLFLYENGATRDLGVANASGAGFNDRGEIVGMTSFGHGPEPFIYDGTLRPIPGAYSYAGAVALNNAGQILCSGEGVYGFLVENGQAVTLDSLARTAGGTITLHHSEGKAINDRGWIVGQGGSPDFHAFLLTPKEAAAAAAQNPVLRPALGARRLARPRSP